MADSTFHSGTKRSYSSSMSEQQPHKRQRVRHTIHHLQRKPDYIEPAPQDPAFVGSQLLRSIRFAVEKVGFDGVQRTTLEMFRSHAEEYMLRFGTHIRNAMHAQRRVQPTAQDFAIALAHMEPENTRTASDFKDTLRRILPESVSYPSIPNPDPQLPPIPDFHALLATDAEGKKTHLVPPARHYIPKHFPPLPATHTWMDTPKVVERETNTRKMREMATKEGLDAEKALRRLATAAKAGAMKAEKKRTSTALSGPGKVRQGGQKRLLQDEYDSFADAMKDVGGTDGDGDVGMGMDGANDAEEGIDTGMPEGLVVNYNMGHWRHGGSRKAMRL